MLHTGAIFYPAVLWMPILTPAVVLGVFLLFTSVHFRLGVVVLGALFILQTSQKLDPIKIGYLAGFCMAFAIGLLRSSPYFRLHRSLLAMSSVLFALAALSFFVAAVHGASLANWLRDVTALLMLAAAPIFALDAEISGDESYVALMFAITGLMAGAAFSIQYITGRAMPGTTHGDRLALVTLLLPAAFFSYSSARALAGKTNKGVWALLSLFLLAILVLSARRQVFALMLLPVVIMLASGGSLAKGIIRLGLIVGAGVLVFTLLLGYFSKSLAIRKDTVVKRLATVVLVLENPRSDQSFEMRLSETLVATAAFLEDPVTGVGPGHIFKYRDTRKKARPTWAIVDTPMAIPAKYGLIGVGLFLLAATALIAFLVGLVRTAGRSASVLALIGFSAFSAGRALLGPPFDDKGYSIGLMFLLALCLIDARDRLRATTPDPDSEGGVCPVNAG